MHVGLAGGILFDVVFWGESVDGFVDVLVLGSQDLVVHVLGSFNLLQSFCLLPPFLHLFFS